MNTTQQIAKQFRAVYLDGRWVANTNLKDQLADVTWEQAIISIHSLNSLAALTYHLNYYVAGVLQVLEGGTLDIRDKYSFDLPPIASPEDWSKLLEELWHNAQNFADLIEQMPDEKLKEVFVDEKYGTYARNLSGMIEHSYYHLGQIVLIKKMILQEVENK